MTTLETSYRRWLSAYPAWHRDRYEEEMIGVLLAAADPDQRRPRIQEITDLLRGGLIVRIRHTFDRREWRDALTLVGLLAPLVILASLARHAIAVTMHLAVLDQQSITPHWTAVLFTAPAWLSGGGTALFAILGWRRTTAVSALITTALTVPTIVAETMHPGQVGSLTADFAALALIAPLTGVALLATAGSEDRRKSMGRRTSLVAVTAMAVAWGLLSPFDLIFLGSALGWSPVTDLGFLLSDRTGWLLLVPALATAVLLRTAAGRRATALLLIASSPLLLHVLELLHVVGLDVGSLEQVILSLVVLPLVAIVFLLTVRGLIRKVGGDSPGGFGSALSGTGGSGS